MNTYHSHGKLLLTGEYVILDGAVALALPTKFGQSLKVIESSTPGVDWKSLDQDEQVWFSHKFSFSEIASPALPSDMDSPQVLKTLHLILHKCAQANPDFLNPRNAGYRIVTQTDFPLDWGLGTSSTLIANIAKWLSVDPYELLRDSFGGSGYDIAIAMRGEALTYQLNRSGRSILSSSFDPPFKDKLFFVHLNRKQNSRDSIQHYKARKNIEGSATVEKISSITQQILTCTTLTEFNLLLEIHENLMSTYVNLPKIKSALFPDFPGSIKSLGGWGGDFILATGGKQEQEYFKKKGYHTVLTYDQIIL